METDKLKPGWKIVQFGDVVRNVNLVEKEPLSAGIEKVVGLEHLDPGDLHIRRWNSIEDDTSFSRKFLKGQTLFGKRRSYQRKVAFAEFEGICSGDILTFETKNTDVLLPELLPFICQTDAFYEYALGTSAGSLSPRTSWNALKEFKFPLPPLEEQRRMADILWVADNAVDKWNESLKNVNQLINAVVNNTVSIVKKRSWPIKKLEEIAKVERGKFTHRPRNLPEFYGGSFPFAQTGDVQRANIHITDFEYYLTDNGRLYSKSFPKGTIFITIAAVIGATAVTVKETWATDSVVGIIPNKEVNVYYLEYYLRTYRHYLENVVATQTAQKNINLKILRPLEIPLPPLEFQLKVVSYLNRIIEQSNLISEHILTIRNIMKMNLNNIGAKDV